MLEDFHAVRMWFAALAIDKQRDRHSPGPLPRNTPVRPALYHRPDPLFAPFRDPPNSGNRGQRLTAKALPVHADKPLRRRAKNHRRLVPPAVRVAVAE